jgi:outer membrane protein assembly factor BamB
LKAVFRAFPPLVLRCSSGRGFAPYASSGAYLWSYPDTFNSTFNSPTVAKEMVYAGSNGGSLYAFDSATGALVWTYPVNNQVTSVAVANGVV